VRSNNWQFVTSLVDEDELLRQLELSRHNNEVIRQRNYIHKLLEANEKLKNSIIDLHKLLLKTVNKHENKSFVANATEMIN